MQRELKFRMPIMVGGKFSHWHYWGFFNGEFVGPDAKWVNVSSQQFTGLKDKNGADVYEGDVVQFKEYYAHIKWWSTVEEIPQIAAQTERKRLDFHFEKRDIRFDDGVFKLASKPLSKYSRSGALVEYMETGQTHNGDFETKMWDFEIIGNTTENPELLT